MGTLFAIVVSIIIAGWLWFFVVRPILESYGVIRVDAEPENVNSSQLVMSSIQEGDSADDADRHTDRPSVSADNLEVPRLQLDKTKAAIIEVLVYNGWGTGEIRSVLRGDNGVTGQEVEAARQRLGIDPPERILRVRDEKGERVISY